MDELLKKLLAAEVLTEETKQELEAAFSNKLTEAIQKARDEAQATVTAELNEQWITEREIVIEALDAKVTEAMTEELGELREDIDRFRDLEVEYAEKLNEAKADMKVTLQKDIAQLIEKLDSFLQIRLTAELEEFREDVDAVKKQEFGKTVFEAFVAEFKKHYADDDSTQAKLTETEHRLEDTLSTLEETEKRLAKMERSIKLEKVLSPLSGRTREVMEAILKNVDTPLLEEAYKTYVGRVLKETSAKDVKASEKEDQVLAEGKEVKKVRGVVKSGDNEEQLVEESVLEQEVKQQPTNSNATREWARRLGGV